MSMFQQQTIRNFMRHLSAKKINRLSMLISKSKIYAISRAAIDMNTKIRTTGKHNNTITKKRNIINKMYSCQCDPCLIILCTRKDLLQ